MGWGQALKGFLIALPELVKMIRPIVDFLVELLGPNPAKKAAELGEGMRLLVESQRIEDIEKKKAKKYEALEKLADFARSN